MTDTLSTKEAALLIGTSEPTVRELVKAGKELTGYQHPRGSTFSWRIDAASVHEYLARNGKFKRRARRAGRPSIATIANDLADLRATVETGHGGGLGAERIQRERDDLRATVVTLREAVARSQTVAELHEQADAERAAVIEHLAAAVSAGERADAIRRAAGAELQEAVAAASRAGHPGDLRSEGESG